MCMSQNLSTMFELKKKLEEAGIPFETRTVDLPGVLFETGFIIAYPSFNRDERKGDVACHSGTHGIEAYGFDIPDNGVRSWLTVDEAFNYFKNAYEKDKKKKEEEMNKECIEKAKETLFKCVANTDNDEDVKTWTFTMKLDGTTSWDPDKDDDDDDEDEDEDYGWEDCDEDEDDDDESCECTFDAGINIVVGGIRVENLDNVDDAIKMLDYILTKGLELSK